MRDNKLAGIGDAYWYEWYVGLEKVLDLLNPDSGVAGVTLQASQQQGLDDVVVRYDDKKLECIQVKHTRTDATLTYTFLFCKHIENGKTKPACIREYSDDWKSVKDTYRQCVPIIYTNKKIGNKNYTPTKGKGYKRPPLKDFWSALKNELNNADSISDVRFSAMTNDSKASEREKGKMYKVAFDNILRQIPSLSDDEKLIFLKEFQIHSDEENDLKKLKKFVSKKLSCILNIDERQCEKYHDRLVRELSEWTVSTRSEEEITKEQVLSVLGLKKDELIGEHNFATEEPFFQSRVRWIKDLKDEILEKNKGVFFISGEPGTGKSNIINYMANEDNSIITTRFHSFKPINVENDVMPADEGIYSSEDFWKNTLIQIKDKFEGCMEKYNVPVAVEAIKSVDKKIEEVLRLAKCLYKKTGKTTVIAVDGIDHAARVGKKNTFLKTLPSPSRLPEGVVFVLAGQPYSNNPEYPLWLDGNDVITKTVPALGRDDIKQLLTNDNICYEDATIEEIAEYILSVTKGNTLSVMYAVYDAKGHDSICDYEKYITDRKLANGIDAYYDYIWQSAMDKWGIPYKHVEIVLSGTMTLLNRGITLDLLQALLQDLIKITDIQLVCWMQSIEPLIIKNNKGAYSAYANDVRLFLRRKFEKSGESKRIVADKVCEYILKENTNVALKHDSLFRSLIMAGRRKEIPRYFDAKYAYEAVIENRPLNELEDQTYTVLEVLAENGELNCLVDVTCAISTITQYQNSIFPDEEFFGNVEEPLSCEKQALSKKTITAEELLRALVQIKQLAEAGYEDRAKGTFKRWIGNRTPGQIGNKYASEEERQRHYNFNDTLKNVLRMSGKLCFIFGERLFEDESLKKGEEDAEAFFAEGVFEACEDSIDTAGIDKVYQLIKCYYPDDNNKFMDKILLTGKKEIIEYFVNQMGKGMGWTEKVQAAENLLKAKRILGYSGRKEYGGYNLMRWYENISSDKPQVWKSLGIQLFNISGVISETGDNRADVYVDAAIASSAGRCGIKDIIRFSYIPNSKDAQWHQTVFDAIIAYLENGKEDKNSLLSLWKCVCRVFPVLEGSSEYSYQNNINTVYREDLKKAILTNAEKNKIVIVEEMKKTKPDCFDKVCKLRETYKIPSRWFEMDDIITYDDSLQECIVKSLQKRNIGSKEWKPIASLLKYAVERGENTWFYGDKEVFKATFLSTLTNRVQIKTSEKFIPLFTRLYLFFRFIDYFRHLHKILK